MKEKMYRKESQILLSLLTTIVILVLYTLYVYNREVVENPEIINNLKFWGKYFVILIPVMIVVQIVIHIIYAIINKIVTNEDIPTKDDEMDRLIELKSLRISRWIQSAFFVMAMGALAIGMQLWVMFVLLLCSCFVSIIVESIAQIYFYTKGVKHG